MTNKPKYEEIAQDYTLWCVHAPTPHNELTEAEFKKLSFEKKIEILEGIWGIESW